MELDKQSNRVVNFNDDEQEKFSVPPQLTATQAVRTAIALTYVANGLNERALSLDAGTLEGKRRQVNLQRRAAEFVTFSAGVYALFPDDHLQALAEGQDGSE